MFFLNCELDIITIIPILQMSSLRVCSERVRNFLERMKLHLSEALSSLCQGLPTQRRDVPEDPP